MLLQLLLNGRVLERAAQIVEGGHDFCPLLLLPLTL